MVTQSLFPRTVAIYPLSRLDKPTKYTDRKTVTMVMSETRHNLDKPGSKNSTIR